MSILPNPSPLLRLTSTTYGDGVGSFVSGADPLAVAQQIFDQDGNMPNPAGWSALMVSWGQFIDHDLSLTRDASGELVMVPGLAGPFQRSVHTGGTGPGDPRQPVNEITPQMDASMVYGSTAARTNQLRSHEGGQMRTSTDPASGHGLLPMASEADGMAGAEVTHGPLFLAGDIRANENAGLTMLQTLWVREHNYWAKRLEAQHPEWSDGQLFDAARSIVEVEIQTITYRDWLPKLLAGNAAQAPVSEVLAPSAGHDSSANGQVSVEFSTAAFRVGHTMVASEMPLMDEGGQANQTLSVMQAFFNTAPFLAGNMDALLRSQTGTAAQAIDAKMIDDLNFFLFGGGTGDDSDGSGPGFSLTALNILRGRDHGLDSYLNTRAALLGDIDPQNVASDDFSVITSDPVLQAQLAQVYDSVHQVGLWVGGLAEDKAGDAQLGPLFAWIVADQFQRTRIADESFGKLADMLGQNLAAEVRDTDLRDIILRNSDVTYLQSDVFKHTERSMGDGGSDMMHGDGSSELLMGMGGNDVLLGEGGRDALYGGAGGDWMRGGNGGDMLDGQKGNDMLFGDAGDDLIMGSAGNDRLAGDGGHDTLKGGSGQDTLLGGSGRDTLYGQSGNDRLEGGDGRDMLKGGNGHDTLDGGAGNDRLDGGNGRDTIAGGAGRDTVLGQAGDDDLSGGAGGDVFRFAGTFGDDTVRDFETDLAVEKIDLSGIAAITDLDDLRSNHLTAAGADAIIDDGAGNTIRLLNVQIQSLDGGDFLF